MGEELEPRGATDLGSNPARCWGLFPSLSLVLLLVKTRIIVVPSSVLASGLHEMMPEDFQHESGPPQRLMEWLL